MTFDLEKARAVDIDILAATDWGELRARYRAALAEIERLRGFETAARDLNNDLIRIAGERDELAARVRELEDALVEERAKIVCYDQDSTDEWWNDLSENGSSGKGKNEIRQEAREQLQAEGKIGPDADECPDDLPPIGSPYRSWQITEERVEALKVATGEMDLSENIFYLNSLKTMLKEVEG